MQLPSASSAAITRYVSPRSPAVLDLSPKSQAELSLSSSAHEPKEKERIPTEMYFLVPPAITINSSDSNSFHSRTASSNSSFGETHYTENEFNLNVPFDRRIAKNIYIELKRIWNIEKPVAQAFLTHIAERYWVTIAKLSHNSLVPPLNTLDPLLNRSFSVTAHESEVDLNLPPAFGLNPNINPETKKTLLNLLMQIILDEIKTTDAYPRDASVKPELTLQELQNKFDLTCDEAIKHLSELSLKQSESMTRAEIKHELAQVFGTTMITGGGLGMTFIGGINTVLGIMGIGVGTGLLIYIIASFRSAARGRTRENANHSKEIQDLLNKFEHEIQIQAQDEEVPATQRLLRESETHPFLARGLSAFNSIRRNSQPV